jgi:ketosteroid isomerase-like protein
MIKENGRGVVQPRRVAPRGPRLALALAVVLGGAGEARAQEQETRPEHAMHDAHHSDPAAAEAAVGAVLDQLHAAASAADFDRYFGLYARNAVFLGTDATERWTLDEFKDYARGPFSEGRGWTYAVLERHIAVSEHGHTAWFDERLDNAFLGETRGSGVLVQDGDAWKVAQYNLTIPVPNDLAAEFVARIREATQEP